MLSSHVDRDFLIADLRRQDALLISERNHLIRDMAMTDSDAYPNEAALSHLRTAMQLTFSLAVTIGVLGAVFGSIIVIAGIVV